jgi:hypothetical protein
MKKNITLSAEESLIEQARRKARSQNTTLNQAFRDWLSRFVASDQSDDYASLMKRLAYAKSSRKFARDEMNER